jgi:peptidoglycan-associated lipoprotein
MTKLHYMTFAMTLAVSACATTKEYDWVEVPGSPRPQIVREVVVEQIVQPQPVNLVRDFADRAGDRIYFDTDKSTLRPDAKDILDRQVEWLNQHPDVRVRLEGNADLRGSITYNQALGARRAQAARDYLVAHGIAAPRITSVSFGEDHPIESGEGAEALARNRNVRVILVE